ncbi:MAG: GIY-YIG nuclease family protein [Thermoanaerobaculia bacterium]
MEKRYFVYIMTNRWNTVVYIGVTNSLERRTWEHQSKVHHGFTYAYNINKLVYCEEYLDVRLAIAREKQLKGWTRAKKNALIEAENPEWRDLWEEWAKPFVPATT